VWGRYFRPAFGDTKLIVTRPTHYIATSTTSRLASKRCWSLSDSDGRTPKSPTAWGVSLHGANWQVESSLIGGTAQCRRFVPVTTGRLPVFRAYLRRLLSCSSVNDDECCPFEWVPVDIGPEDVLTGRLEGKHVGGYQLEPLLAAGLDARRATLLKLTFHPIERLVAVLVQYLDLELVPLVRFIPADQNSQGEPNRDRCWQLTRVNHRPAAAQ